MRNPSEVVPIQMGVGIHYFRFEGFKSKIMAFRRVGEK